MKTFADDSWEREVERFSPFRPLWKTDDKNWIASRKEAWRAANDDAGGDPWTLAYGKFYVYGEEPPRCFADDTGGEEDVRFDIIDRISYTPLSTADDLFQFWEVMLKRNPVGASRDHGKFRYIGGHLARFPERDNMVKLVTEAMFSSEFFMRVSEGKEVTSRNLITINPRDFVIGYSGVSPFYHQNNLHEWDYRNFSFEYFMLSVRHCEENNRLVSPRQIEALPNMYEFLLALDDSELSQYRLDLKQKLISAAEADDAPSLLSGALKAARESQS